MAANLQELTDQLIRAQLATPTEIDAWRVEAVSRNQPGDPAQLLRELLDCGRLTPFQAGEFESGRGDRLVLGNYLLLNRIGEGGMGTVYRAMHLKMRRYVALKTLKSECQSENFVSRFRREVQAAARLNHPHAVAAYDADESPLGHYLVMEFVDGEDLNTTVRRHGPLAIAEAVTAIRQAAEALAYAHRFGIVHRDIKPANLLRDGFGNVKVADLGLAQLRDDPERGSLTQDGTSMGTVDFIPPEQAVDAASVDHRADIYSLGCTLFFLLAGRPLYDSPSLIQRLVSHRDAAIPSLRAARPDVPESLEAVYRRMVAKSPDDRFATMDDVLTAIEPFGAAPDGRSESVAFSELTVLLVEPSTFQANVVQKYLRDLGVDDIHVQRTVSATREGLRRLRPDLVVTSFQLPDSSGIEFAQRLRDELHWSRTPIVLMTGDELTEAQLEFIRAAPAMALLTKPFKAQDLEASVRQVLQDSRRQSAGVAGLERLSVLIVDDSSVARRRMEKTLLEIGFARFTHAENGQLATEELSRREFALVVTDYNMPEMNGGELVAWIRRSHQPHLPVIVCTTEFDPEKLAPIYQLGVSAICNKSFEVELVRNIVIRLFK